MLAREKCHCCARQFIEQVSKLAMSLLKIDEYSVHWFRQFFVICFTNFRGGKKLPNRE